MAMTSFSTSVDIEIAEEADRAPGAAAQYLPLLPPVHSGPELTFKMILHIVPLHAGIDLTPAMYQENNLYDMILR